MANTLLKCPTIHRESFNSKGITLTSCHSFIRLYKNSRIVYSLPDNELTKFWISKCKKIIPNLRVYKYKGTIAVAYKGANPFMANAIIRYPYRKHKSLSYLKKNFQSKNVMDDIIVEAYNSSYGYFSFAFGRYQLKIFPIFKPLFPNETIRNLSYYFANNISSPRWGFKSRKDILVYMTEPFFHAKAEKFVNKKHLANYNKYTTNERIKKFLSTWDRS